MTAPTHPLFGLLLEAHHFRRVDGELFLVATLPDGSPGTIRAEATDVLASNVPDASVLVLDGQGVQELRRLVTVLQPARGKRIATRDDK